MIGLKVGEGLEVDENIKDGSPLAYSGREVGENQPACGLERKLNWTDTRITGRRNWPVGLGDGLHRSCRPGVNLSRGPSTNLDTLANTYTVI